MDESPESLTARWGRAPVRVARLESEIDATYRATFADGTEAVLKIAPLGVGAAELDFEAALIQAALEADPALPLARPLRTGGGETRLRSTGRWVRLIECLPGVDASSSPVDLAVVRTIGREAGRFTRALEDFRHPADLRSVAWDIRRAPRLLDRVPQLDDTDVRETIVRVLDELDAALPVLAALPAQVVHNDLNGGNILVDAGTVTGIVDMGDAGFAPRVCDVGIAMSYTLGYTDESDAWSAPRAFLEGYRDVIELLPDELALLPLLVRARAAQRILMSVDGAASLDDEGRRDESARIRRASADLRRLIAAGGEGSRG